MYEYTLTRWLDQLGLLALSGQRVQCRQTLVSRHTLARPCLDPNPNPNANANATPTPTPTPNPNPSPKPNRVQQAERGRAQVAVAVVGAPGSG